VFSEEGLLKIRRAGHLRREAKIGIRVTKAKECKSHQKLEKARNASLLESSEGI
jgi:hypothetical protein